MKQKEIIPLTPQTGGVLNPDQIIGRDKEINNYWEILRRQGIVLYAERRFGKSSILIKMNSENREDFVTIHKGVEGATNVDEFVNNLFDRIKEKKIIEESRLKAIEDIFYSLTAKVDQVGGIKFKPADKKWEKQFYYLLKLLTEQHKGKYIVIMLDEFSIMLSKMKESEAVNILGFLRDLVSQEFPDRLRFVYCGSIGIDLVLDKLKRAGCNIGDPINHLNKQRLLPFSEDEAFFFCGCLAKGCELELTAKTIKYICEITDNIPYFIDAIFDKIRYINPINIKEIDKVLHDILNDANNTSNLKHFYDRIDEYYPDKILTNQILNFLSKQEVYIMEEDIANYINQLMDVNRIVLNEEIDRLWRDGYFKREIIENKRCFQFNYSIIKKWWAINKAN